MSTPQDPVEDLLEQLAQAEHEARRLWLRQVELAHALLGSVDVGDEAVAADAGASAVTVQRVSRVGHLLSEAAFACRVGPGTVERRARAGVLMTRHRYLAQAVAEGRSSASHIGVLVELLAPVPERLHERVLARALPAVEGHPAWELSSSQLRSRVGRVVRQVDPVGARRRREAEAATRVGLRVRQLGEGLAALTATGQAVSVQAIAGLVRRLAVLDQRAGGVAGGEAEVAVLARAVLAAARAAGLDGIDLQFDLELPVRVAGQRGTGPLTPAEPAQVRSDLTPEMVAALVGALRELPADLEAADPDAPDPLEPELEAPDRLEPELEAPDPLEPELEAPDPLEPELEASDPEAPDREASALAEAVPAEAAPEVDSGDDPPALPGHTDPPADRTDVAGRAKPGVERDRPKRVDREEAGSGCPVPELDDVGQAAHVEPAAHVEHPPDVAESPSRRAPVEGAALGARVDEPPLLPDAFDVWGTAPVPPPVPLPDPLPDRAVPLLCGHPVDPSAVSDLLAPSGLPLGLRRVVVRRLLRDTTTGQVVAVDDSPIPLAALAEAVRTALAQQDLGADGASTSGPTTSARELSGTERVARALLAVLTADLPTPPAVHAGYRPTAAQKRLVHARDSHCTFPGCGRRVAQCELDHRQPYRTTKNTSVSNLDPVCKHHHRLKHDGWQVSRAADGSHTWTSPRRQTRTSPPRTALDA